MTIPPDSYFEGGEPQSAVAPGDTGRELIHEIRNMNQAVLLLRHAVTRQHTRQKQIIASLVCSVLALALALGYTRLQTVTQTRERILANHAACDQDFQRGAVEIEILEASRLANKGNPQADAFFEPRIQALRGLQKDCAALYPAPGEANWPSFFGL